MVENLSICLSQLLWHHATIILANMQEVVEGDCNWKINCPETPKLGYLNVLDTCILGILNYTYWCFKLAHHDSICTTHLFLALLHDDWLV